MKAAWDVIDGARRDRWLDQGRALGLPTPMQVENAFPTRNDPELWEAFTGQLPGALPAVTQNTVMAVTTVYACVNLIAGVLSTLPIAVYRRAADGERSALTNDDIWWLLNEQMCPRWSAANGWEWLALCLLLRGNGYAIIRREGPRVRAIVPVDPMRVEVFVQPGGERLSYVIHPDPADILGEAAKREVLDQDDMLHFAGLGFNGVVAPSPLRHQLRGASQVAMATQDYAGQFFANGARPDYVLHSDNKVSPEQIALIRETIQQNHGGPLNARKPMLLTDGLKFQSVTMPMEDVELLGLRAFQVEELCRCFGVLPWMIGHDQKMALGGGGAESIGTFFRRFTMQPHLKRIVSELNRKLFRTAAKFTEHDTFGLEKADMKALFEAFRIAVGRAGEPGFMDVNEVRRLLNMGSRAGGDELNKAAPTAAPAEGGNDA